MDSLQRCLPKRLLVRKYPQFLLQWAVLQVFILLFCNSLALSGYSTWLSVGSTDCLPGFLLSCAGRGIWYYFWLLQPTVPQTLFFLACLIIFLHLICQSLWAFLFSSFGYSFCFLNDAFSILINSFTSQIFSSLLHHACFFLLFLKFFLTDSMHRSSAFSRMFFGSPCAVHKYFILSATSFSFFLNNFPHFHILLLLKV